VAAGVPGYCQTRKAAVGLLDALPLQQISRELSRLHLDHIPNTTMLLQTSITR
jgi:hypothetical protein